MITDNFNTWYKNAYPNSIPEDDMYVALYSAYEAGWHRHREIEECLTNLAQESEKWL